MARARTRAIFCFSSLLWCAFKLLLFIITTLIIQPRVHSIPRFRFCFFHPAAPFSFLRSIFACAMIFAAPCVIHAVRVIPIPDVPHPDTLASDEMHPYLRCVTRAKAQKEKKRKKRKKNKKEKEIPKRETVICAHNLSAPTLPFIYFSLSSRLPSRFSRFPRLLGSRNGRRSISWSRKYPRVLKRSKEKNNGV